MTSKPRPLILLWGLAWMLVGTSTLPCGAQVNVVAARSLSVNDGLSNNHVTAIAQDHAGFTWIGTALGLTRTDGHNFEIFSTTTGNKPGLSADAIYSLHVDGSGKLWVGTDRGLDQYEPNLNSFRKVPGVLDVPRFVIRSIDSDPAGNIWVTVGSIKFSQPVVARISPATGEIRHYSIPAPANMDADLVRVVDPSNVLVACRNVYGRSSSDWLFVGALDPRTGNFRRFSPETMPAPTAVHEKDLSLAGRGQAYWLGVPGSRIYKVDMAHASLKPVSYAKSLDDTAGTQLVSRVVQDPRGKVWVARTWRHEVHGRDVNTIYELGWDGEPTRPVAVNPAGPCNLSRNFVIASFIDDAGILWQGLSGAGACATDLESGMFSSYNASSSGILLGSDFVRAVARSARDIVWVGTRSGLDRIDRTRSSVTHFHHDPADPGSLSDDEVQSILVDRRGDLWVGTQFGGLNRSAGQAGKFIHYRHKPGVAGSIGEDNVVALLEDHMGDIWASTKNSGLSRFDRSTGAFVTFRKDLANPHSLSSNNPTALLEDSKGSLWVGSGDGGINRFDRASGQFVRGPLGGSPPPVHALAEDPRSPGILWLGTQGKGLIRYSAESGEATSFTTANSRLPGNTVFSLIADSSGSIWAGTNRGLVRVDARTQSLTPFGMSHGLQSLEFTARAAFHAPDGELFFGGVGGLNAFNPSRIPENRFPPKVALTAVRVYDPTAGGTSGPYQAIYQGRGVPTHAHLPYRSRDLVFNFVALQFADPETNTCRYRLDPLDTEWREGGVSREVAYSNLSPGSYRFRVIALTSRGVRSASEAVYEFTIARPFYLNPWLYAFAAITIVLAGVSGHRVRMQRMRKIHADIESKVHERTNELGAALGVIEKQAAQLRDSDALKSRFITNIAHDLRTPLAFSLAALADIRSGLHGQLPGDAAQTLDQVLNNEHRLLRLVNQLLAIARLDSGILRLRVCESDLTAMACEIGSIFDVIGREKHISVECIADGPQLAYVDPEWMGEVVVNLLTNAVKFSPVGGKVTIRVGRGADGRGTCLEVRDQGPGIPAEELPRIFDRYFQSDRNVGDSRAGVGIGLSLVKEIVTLHKGEIAVQSAPGEGTLFRIVLRDGNAHFTPEQLAPGSGTASEQRDLHRLAGDLELAADDLAAVDGDDLNADDDRPLILIAEDDRDLRQFLVKRFRRSYRVIAAAAGEEAWEATRTEVPDLVISDVRMPGVDGYQLCRMIREHPETDFLPVVLLSAKAAVEERLEGLDCGADDYMVKPFEAAELEAKVRNILDSRGKLRTKVAGALFLDAATKNGDPPESADAVFIKRVYERMKESSADRNFSVEQLSRELFMSRMHLYRRIRTLLGKSPSELLVEYRLERAASLLGAASGTVSEVAYEVGFKSISHFTRRFREKFGQTPSEYRARAAKNTVHG